MSMHHDLYQFGKLHVTQATRAHFKELYDICDNTPCFAAAHPVSFSPKIKALLNQTGVKGALCMNKGPDSHIFTVALPNGKHQIVSVVDPVHLDPAVSNSIRVYAIVRPPKSPPVMPFYLSEGNGLTDFNVIARTCPVKHILDKLLVPAAASSIPTSIFHAPTIGKVLTRLLTGQPGYEVESAFTALLDQGHSTIYGTPMELNERLASLLMLDEDPQIHQNILIDRCENGIVAYTRRPCGARTFHSLISSSNFFADALPPTPENSKVHILTMRYGKDIAPHHVINVIDHHTKCNDVGDIPLNLNVQQIQNIIEFTFRKHHQQITGADKFAPYLDLIQRLHTAPPDADVNEFIEGFRQLGLLPKGFDVSMLTQAAPVR